MCKKKTKKREGKKKTPKSKCLTAKVRGQTDGPRGGAEEETGGEEVWARWKALVCAGTLPVRRTETHLAAPTPTDHLLVPERSVLCIDQIFILQKPALT